MEVGEFKVDLIQSGYSQEEAQTLIRYIGEDFPQATKEELQGLIRRLIAQEPYAYIAGYQPFLNLKIKVNSNVLIPRPETEELIQFILKANTGPAPLNALDLGTGSGCIALALKAARPQWKLHAIDLYESALNVARTNSSQLNLPVDFYLFSMENADRWRGEEMSLMVSNPPYVPKELAPNLDVRVRDFEPASALFSPENQPLHYYTCILKWVKLHLKSSGWLWLETDAEGHESTRQLLIRSAIFKQVESLIDFRGNPRFLKAQKK